MRGLSEEKFSQAKEVRIGEVLGEYVSALPLGVNVNQLYRFVLGQVSHVVLFNLHVFVVFLPVIMRFAAM